MKPRNKAKEPDLFDPVPAPPDNQDNVDEHELYNADAVKKLTELSKKIKTKHHEK